MNAMKYPSSLAINLKISFFYLTSDWLVTIVDRMKSIAREYNLLDVLR
jgi:hypothetical protein